jgi:hypothetical protein
MAAWWPRLPLLAALGLLLGCAAPAPVKGPDLFLLHPTPPDQREYAMESGALVYRWQGLEVTVRPLDPRRVEEGFRSRGVPSPFAIPVDGPPPLIFQVTLANGGGRTLYFNPSQARGLDEERQRCHPLNATDLHRAFQEDSRRDDRLRVFRDEAFDIPLQVRPGASVSRYLAFTPPPGNPSTLLLSLPLRYDGAAGLQPLFAFEVFGATSGEGGR